MLLLIYCTDINECLIGNGGCEFSCTNLEGINSTTGLGYQCGCDNGYQLVPNNHDCTGMCVSECDHQLSTLYCSLFYIVVTCAQVICLICSHAQRVMAKGQNLRACINNFYRNQIAIAVFIQYIPLVILAIIPIIAEVFV